MNYILPKGTFHAVTSSPIYCRNILNYHSLYKCRKSSQQYDVTMHIDLRIATIWYSKAIQFRNTIKLARSYCICKTIVVLMIRCGGHFWSLAFLKVVYLDNKKIKIINDLHIKHYHDFYNSLRDVVSLFQTIPSSKIWSVSALISSTSFYFLVLSFASDDVYIAYFLSAQSWSLAMLTAKFSTISTIQNQHHI